MINIINSTVKIMPITVQKRVVLTQPKHFCSFADMKQAIHIYQQQGNDSLGQRTHFWIFIFILVAGDIQMHRYIE